MRYRALGPLRVWDGAGWRPVGAAQPRLLLAILLAEAGRLVSTDRLVDEIWADRPPRTAVNTVHGYVARLRRLLGDRSGQQLVTAAPGYQLLVGAGELDAREFERLADAGQRNLAAGRSGPAGVELAAALALWRGPALADVRPSPAVAAEVGRLAERRLAVLEGWAAAELDLGGHAALIPELRRLVDEYPLAERLRGQLMLALDRSGRRAEALAAYRVGRARLVTELGLEPGPELRAVQHAVLAGDAPARVRRRGPVLPAQLPADVADFTGRTDPLRRLDAHLPAGLPETSGAGTAPGVGTASGASGVGSAAGASGVGTACGVGVASGASGLGTASGASGLRTASGLGTASGVGSAVGVGTAAGAAGGPDPAAVVVVLLTGPAGAGKSALAVHWAHRVRRRFPDGQLYADLRAGGGGAPPGQPLTRFLHALGVPPRRVPADPDDAASLYRTMLADRRMLVLLDNAGSPGQVRPLLPGAAGCLLLVTSRDPLTGLVARDGAHRVTLDPFTAAEATALLTRLLGADRVGAEQPAVAELVDRYGRLPLTLRLVAADLAGQRHRTIADHLTHGPPAPAVVPGPDGRATAG